ncbi:MAG: diguanylate cyclase [Nitrospiraceae bacterium]|nr:diguanylate cyclase [Nitrospiraceae bacterium]
MNLTLRKQIFLSYIVMILFSMCVGGYAIWSLTELTTLTSDIILNDMSTAEKLTKLQDSILAQDLYEKRYLTLRQSEAENQFWSRSRDFKSLLTEVSSLAPALRPNIANIAAYHDTYTRFFAEEVAHVNAGRQGDAAAVSAGPLKRNFDQVLFLIKDVELKTREGQSHHISRSNSLGERSLVITITLSVVTVVFGILFAYLITNHLTTAIDRLKAATHSIRSGDFDNLPEIHGADELADLAISFKEMSARLKELEEMNLDANPLTKLPGNLAIEKELLTRLNETQKFSFCLIDLDNFKGFNDRYGYARGSDVIKWLGDTLLGIKKELGTPEDFLGHIGGDDFVIICSPERVQAVCNRIIEEFDHGITGFYDPEDVKKGFIVSIDRNDKPAIFGIMTVSIAVVNTDRTLIREPKEVALKVTELKQYAKTFAKSLCIMDRRRQV